MADNTQINTGAGGDVIATDDIGGVKHQRVKMEFGDDGIATDVSAINPLPVAEKTVDDQIAILNEINEAVSVLANARGVLADLRTTVVNTVPVSGTLTGVTTVTGVTTLSNQSQIGSYAANSQIPSLMNTTAIQSNINNVIVT